LEAVDAPEGQDDGKMNVTIAVRPTEEERTGAANRRSGSPSKEADKKDAENKAAEATEGDTANQGTKKKSSGSSASSRHGQASAAREYLDQHNLVEFTQLLVQSVIKEQPEKPYAFMARQFYFPDPKPRPNTCPAMDTGKAEAVMTSDPGAKLTGKDQGGTAPEGGSPLDALGGVPGFGSTPVDVQGS